VNLWVGSGQMDHSVYILIELNSYLICGTVVIILFSSVLDSEFFFFTWIPNAQHMIVPIYVALGIA
jgi:hypothetical protein